MVNFNPVVEVQEMSVDWDEHAQEIKNPKDFVKVVPRKSVEHATAVAATTDSGSPWAIIIIIMVIIILAFLLVLKKMKGKTSKESYTP
jgi:hypothetical protein